MSAPTPEPVLSESERRALDDLAAHENAGDPGFVLRMQSPRPEVTDPEGARAEAVVRGRRRDRAIQAAVLGAIVAVVLPLAWTIALVLTLALVIGPTILIVRALREGGLQPPTRGPDHQR